jgi:ribosomal protein S18 acetylase RimI-like enzyme
LAFENIIQGKDGYETREAYKPMKPIAISFNRMELAISIMREVAAWGREQGYRVWPDEWLTPEELITPDARPENFCVGYIDGEAACAFILQWADAVYWPHAPEYEAAYLHKFCVRRKFAGMGMTKLVVDALRVECGRRNVRYIRLDTGLDEKKVRKIYLNAGFKIVDIIDYQNGNSMALYELAL